MKEIKMCFCNKLDQGKIVKLDFTTTTKGQGKGNTNFIVLISQRSIVRTVSMENPCLHLDLFYKCRWSLLLYLSPHFGIYFVYKLNIYPVILGIFLRLLTVENCTKKNKTINIWNEKMMLPSVKSGDFTYDSRILMQSEKIHLLPLPKNNAKVSDFHDDLCDLCWTKL